MKFAIVIGASSGVGKETAKLLSEENYEVLLIARNEDKLNKLKSELKSKSYVLPLDMTKEKSVLEIKKFVLENNKKIAVILNAIGEGKINEITNVSTKEWMDMFSINVTSVFFIMRELLPLLYSQKEGVIINISSEAGKEGFATYGAYCSAKFALTGLTQSVQQEARLKGVKVHLISPGDIDTPFMDKCPIDMDLMKKYDIKVCSKDKMLTAKQVAKGILFLINQPKNVFIPDLDILPEDFE